jgi:hypothetical protein
VQCSSPQPPAPPLGANAHAGALQVPGLHAG